MHDALVKLETVISPEDQTTIFALVRYFLQNAAERAVAVKLHYMPQSLLIAEKLSIAYFASIVFGPMNALHVVSELRHAAKLLGAPKTRKAIQIKTLKTTDDGVFDG